MKAYSHLSAEERVRIDELRNRDGLGVRQIALRIGRDKSTISRELKRGLWFASNENDPYRPYRPERLKTGAWTSRPFYSAMTAQRKAETRARRSRKPLRMAYDPPLSWVMDALRKGWTPERIEGRLTVEFPDDPRMRVSHECLYRWIYAKLQRTLDLRQYLPRGKRHHTRARGRRSKGPHIPMRVPIADRPKRVDSRREFGHFESDTVIGAAPSKRCIDTQVERKSRKLFARFIPDKSALATARAEYDIYKDIPAPARIDRTWDNGTESSCHLLVDEALGMLTYFADPYSSYQRGTNENRNGRIRRYLPKKTGLDDLTDADLQAIVDEINDTPMKVLGWETPNEVWYRELGKVMSKTRQPTTGVALTN
ncbi:IS30 family transposase [Bifidobacterium miconisargentati]|uniref:IS30 family transposase n=1 Tax=Bifidobacterium miconisargentati TaxID=2834437 RepID=UPI001BDD1D05|nr:IS30 family transposase [Bifidobacterium miconisargentati]MBW3089224.1 IS30 family transposase [Bifidobacterium miconisargentati]